MGSEKLRVYKNQTDTIYLEGKKDVVFYLILECVE